MASMRRYRTLLLRSMRLFVQRSMYAPDWQVEMAEAATWLPHSFFIEHGHRIVPSRSASKSADSIIQTEFEYAG